MKTIVVWQGRSRVIMVSLLISILLDVGHRRSRERETSYACPTKAGGCFEALCG
jgi:hypothetical protein